MADTPPAGARSLTEVERQAFQRLSLTEGHWAALAPAPLFYQVGLRIPNRRSRDDLDAADRLRCALRTLPGLSTEALHFWDRLGDGTRSADAKLATRLLAWHLATDRPFRPRAEFEILLGHIADRFQARGKHPPNAHDQVIVNFRWLVDAYLPYPEFLPNGEPPRVDLSPPSAANLEGLAAKLVPHTPPPWPSTHPLEVPRQLPTLTQIMGEPVSDWWTRLCDPARRAVERGLAGMPFEFRRSVYRNVYNEWFQALRYSFPTWANLDDFARRFFMRIREWVEAVRLTGRGAFTRTPVVPVPETPARAAPPPDLAILVWAPPVAPPLPVAPLASVAPAEPMHPEMVRLPAALREPPPKPVAPKPVEKPRPERVTARTAEPFELMPMDRALARAATATVEEVCAWVAAAPKLLFDDCRDEHAKHVAVVRTENAVPPALWVVGDLHADVLTLANIIALAEARSTQEQPAHYLFLGDFVDRGIHDHETLLLLFRLMMDHPERVCVVPGNHDIDLAFEEAAGRFRVTIEPAEYCENLNAALEHDTPEAGARVALAKAFIKFCAGRPKAVFLPDGTLFAHGGFPHTDAQKDLAALPDLCRPKCLDDFLWARIAESARVKRPNRGSRGHEFGWDTFAQFCKLVTEKLDVPVKRLVRGHDHVTDRWTEYPEYADNGVPVLTINAMGRLLDGESARRDGRPHPFPVVGKHTANHLPEVIVLPLDPEEVDRAFRRARHAEPPAAEGGA